MSKKEYCIFKNKVSSLWALSECRAALNHLHQVKSTGAMNATITLFVREVIKEGAPAQNMDSKNEYNFVGRSEQENPLKGG